MRVLALAVMLAPVSLQAVDENALLRYMDTSSTLVDLEKQREALEQNQMGMTPLPDKDFKKRKRDLDNAIRKEQTRIKEVHKACSDLFAKGKKNVLTATDKQGRTLLMWVASLGQDEATRLVLADNPPLTPVDKDGRTALNYETESGGSALREYVMEKWGKAVTAGDTEAASELLDAGVNPSDPVNGEPPLAIAIRNRHGAMVTLLTGAGASLTARSMEGYTLLELACRVGDSSAVPVLLSMGADDGSKFSNGASPLFYLATVGSVDCFREYINTTGIIDRGLLPCFITRVGSADKIRLVVKDAAAANREDAEGNMPIHEAARRGDLEIFNLLLETGGSRTATNSRGETTLMHAALSGNEDVLRAAMEGLSPEELRAKDKKGANAADYAKRSGNRDVCKILEDAGVKPKK